MGRNRKGLSYFPFDIDFFQDLKIRKLIRCQGGKAVTVYALLLCFIYKSGYYIWWDEELPFAISEQTGYDEAYIREVIKSCVTLGLFSRELFENEGVLTSRGIQERYAEICELSRRVYVIEQFNLISEQKEEVSAQKKAISVQKNDINVQKPAISATKRKVNKTKKENISDDMSKKAADAPFSTPTDIPFSDSENPESGLKTSEEIPPPGSAPPPSPRIDYSAIMLDFNTRFAGVLPAVTVMTEKRKAAVRARIGEHGMDSIAKVFDSIAVSGFLKGHNNHNWKADFDWVFRPTNYVKILEGNYTKTGYGRKEQRQFGNTRPGDFTGKGYTDI